MPDHLHLLWAGLSEESDQDKAAASFRKHVNRLLAREAGAGAEPLPAPGAPGAGSRAAPITETSGAGSRAAPTFALQKQAWDVVLRERDREGGAIERLLFYITESPVRGKRAAAACDWTFAVSQAAGYPDLDWRDKDFTARLWKIYETEARRYGAARLPEPVCGSAPLTAPGAGSGSAPTRDGGAARLPAPEASSGAGSGSAPVPVMTDDKRTP
jgi:hypothetical protein